MTSKFFTRPASHIFIILVLGALAYSNTLDVPFILDDEDSILRNPGIQNFRDFFPGGAEFTANPRRWLGYFTFAMNYHFGGLDVTGYHLVNLLVHLVTGLLVYAFVTLTFRTPCLAGSRLAPHTPMIGLLAALFFVVHPVQTQAVTYIVQRLTSLCTLFYLLAMVLYIQARLQLECRLQNSVSRGSKDGRTLENGRIRATAVVLLIGSVISAVLAMKTKEIAFTLPLAAALYEVTFFRGEWRRRILSLLPLLLTLPIVPIGVLTAVEDSTGDISSQVSDLRAQTDMPRLHYFFTQFRVIVTYLRLLVLPINQNLDYDYPVFTSFFTLPVVFSFVLLAALFALGLHLWLTGRREPGAASLVSYGIFWFFLTLSVESSIIPIVDVIFEHRLYLPSVGVAIAAATLVILAGEKTVSWLRGRIPLMAALAVIGILAIATWQRNELWGNKIRLWEDVTRKSPEKVRPWYNLGSYLSDEGRAEEAIRALSRAVRLDPDHADAWHNLGRTYLMVNQVAEAEYALRQAVRLKPDMANAVVNLSVALIHAGKSAEAVDQLQRLRPYFPNWPELRLNLGIAYARSGDITAAQGELLVLYRIAPHLVANLSEQIARAGAQ